MTKPKTDTERRFRWWPLFVLFATVTAVWLLAWWLLLHSPHLTSWSERGTFGDMFGAVNAIFSGLAFSGVIFAIFMQRDELELQCRELELTKAELARSADAQQASAALMAQQVRLAALTASLTAEIKLMSRYAHGTIGRDMGINRVLEIQEQITAALNESEAPNA